MIGRVDNAGRALLDVELRASLDSRGHYISVWIDTGFTGEVVLPQSTIDELSLTLTGTVSAVLADGSQVVLRTFECFIAWIDGPKRLEVVANEGACALLGVGLLLERRLVIDYPSKLITLE
jgi:clan AA aspartic protease